MGRENGDGRVRRVIGEREGEGNGRRRRAMNAGCANKKKEE